MVAGINSSFGWSSGADTFGLGCFALSKRSDSTASGPFQLFNSISILSPNQTNGLHNVSTQPGSLWPDNFTREQADLILATPACLGIDRLHLILYTLQTYQQSVMLYVLILPTEGPLACFAQNVYFFFLKTQLNTELFPIWCPLCIFGTVVLQITSRYGLCLSWEIQPKAYGLHKGGYFIPFMYQFKPTGCKWLVGCGIMEPSCFFHLLIRQGLNDSVIQFGINVYSTLAFFFQRWSWTFYDIEKPAKSLSIFGITTALNKKIVYCFYCTTMHLSWYYWH